ncbi:DUF1826 domain-containing protein [Aliidiomarina iranensis]|uniref:DUF1826 domain-containing protein n=1 Tax=Aliidiomarina iranensis TaxID=1434071 RepID=A0A432W129_9GAMM|nr:DUF1826 domain-containing protein [Aliidiomarina iranensis]RUO22601.1 DUF1826 domain-containing protein [Aliidiomarina iranensis]
MLAQDTQIQSLKSSVHVAKGANAMELSSIFKSHINLAIWQREINDRAYQYAQFLQHSTWPQQRVLLNINEVTEHFLNVLPEAPGRASIVADIALLADMYGCLFDISQVGIRFARLTSAMCPKFHTDKLGCRLITTYAGVGSEWLKNEHVWRSDTGKVMHQADAPVQQLNSVEVGILKGDGWADNEHGGIVHRSPQVAENDARVVLTIDGF